MPALSRTMRVPAVLSLAAFVITACGSPSAASDGPSSSQQSRGQERAAAMVGLPIEPGLYAADYMGSCAGADAVFFYDAGNYGYILQALPGDRMNSARSASAEVHPIQRAASGAQSELDDDPDFSGFTRIWSTDDVGGAVQGVKATGDGRFTWREGSPSAHRMEYEDTAYQACAFSQLSSGMQAAIRQFRPQLAGSAPAPASTASEAPSRVAFPPIEKGYWTWSASCPEAIRRNELLYIDDKTWSGATILRINALGGNRYRLYTSFMDDDGPVVSPDLEENDKSILTIHSPVSFTSVSDLSGMANQASRYIHCPTSTIPAAIRRDYEP